MKIILEDKFSSTIDLDTVSNNFSDYYIVAKRQNGKGVYHINKVEGTTYSFKLNSTNGVGWAPPATRYSLKGWVKKYGTGLDLYAFSNKEEYKEWLMDNL